MQPNRPVEQLRNLGPKMKHYLAMVGIEDEMALRAVGPIQAFLRVSELSSHLRNRMALYAIYGALTDQDCMRLPDETKEWLENELRKAGYGQYGPKKTSKRRGGMKVYGIKACDTVKKARNWLENAGIDYEFHDFKSKGVDEDMLWRAVNAHRWEAVLNRKGLTWRQLSNDDKALVVDAASAIAVMMAHPSCIRRPIVEVDGHVLIGFDAQSYAESLKGLESCA